ncbi:hypothetical protein V8B97DRAFT_2089916 [Scleroderma yunnanense]
MAGTQELPSWMTLSIVTITNSEGIPMTTSTTTLELPLTYYGPSIPLGTDGAWTWGGLYPPSSSPSSVVSPTMTPTAASSSTFTATPITSSSSSYSTSSMPTSTATTPAPAATTTSASSTASSSLSNGELIGIIFGALVAFIFSLLLLIWLIRWRVRKQRNGFRPTPIWTHWEVLSPSGLRSTDGDRPPGVGSPRGSGEEIDPFLQHSRSGTNGTQRHRPSARPVASLPPGAAPPVIGSTTSGDSDHTGSSAVTDYGVLLPDTGRIGQAYARDNDPYFPAARASSEMTGHIIPPGELLRIDDEEEPESPPRMYGVPHAEDSDPLLPQFTSLPPPPPLDIEKYSRRGSPANEKEKSVRSLSYPASDMEASEIVTARRVRVRDVGARLPESEGRASHARFEAGPVAGPSSWRSSFGLSSLQKLRLSWFGSSSRHSHSSNGRARSDDIESSQSLLQAPRSRPRSGLGLIISGDRPISTLSTRSAVSGNTVYHDAPSHLGTPVSVPSRVMTPATGGGVTPGHDAPLLPTGAPPAYALQDPYDSMGSRGSFPYPQGVDVLDLPVPVPASPFTASMGTSRGTPPGVQAQERALGESLSVITGSSDEANIAIDVLDAEPPRAGEGWRAMAEGRLIGRGSGSDNGERHTTLGTPQLVHPPQTMLSEQGSLHSMRSYLSPYSRSSGSDSGPGSRHSNNHTGSASSRPSASSRVQTVSSGSVRSGSFSRLRGGGSGFPISPAVSAFGPLNEPSPLSPLAMHDLPSPISRGSAYYSAQSSSDNGGFSRVSVLGPMPSFTAQSVLAPTIRSVGATTTSDETEVTRTTVTAGTGTTGSGGSGPETALEGTDDFVERFRLGDFDMGRVRL